MGIKFERFDVYIISPGQTIGNEIQKIRPCVIVSPNEINTFLGTVDCCPINQP